MGGPIFHRQVQARDSGTTTVEEGPHNQGFHQRELRYLRQREGARSTW